MSRIVTDDNSPRNQFVDDKPPISVSYHPEKLVAVKTFRPRKIGNLKDLTFYVENYVCSPIIYKNDLRLKENFLSAGWIGLDIDSNVSLSEAISMLKEWQATCIVGTTQNHQKIKYTKSMTEIPACDRFRILIEMSSSCTDLELFEFNVSAWIKAFKADASAKDGARLFKPCTVVFSQEAYPQDWIPFPKNYRTVAERRAVQFQSEINLHKQNGSLPRWVLDIQKNGVPPGGNGQKGRHHACYRVGAYLAELDYSATDIGDFLCAGPLKEIGEANVRRQVQCGFDAATLKRNSRGRGTDGP